MNQKKIQKKIKIKLIFIYLVFFNLQVLLQLCTARTISPPGRSNGITDPRDNPTNHLLRRIMGNVRRISDILAFQMLDQEDQHATLEEKRASMVKDPKN